MEKKFEFVDTVEFAGKTYRTRMVYVKGFGPRTIAPSSLEDELLKDGEYVSEEARAIDEDIFYYVDDARFNNYVTAELEKLVSKEVA